MTYTHGSVAASVRRQKELRPNDYCHDPRCLFRVFPDKPCPKHGTPVIVECCWCGGLVTKGAAKFETPSGCTLHDTPDCRGMWAATEQMQSMDGEC